MTHRDQNGLKNEGLQSDGHHGNVDSERQVLIESATWIVKVGSRMIDTSLKTKLNALKIALKEVG